MSQRNVKNVLSHLVLVFLIHYRLWFLTRKRLEEMFFFAICERFSEIFIILLKTEWSSDSSSNRFIHFAYGCPFEIYPQIGKSVAALSQRSRANFSSCYIVNRFAFIRSAKLLSRSGRGRVPVRGQTTSRNMHEHIWVSYPARSIPRTVCTRIRRVLHMWVPLPFVEMCFLQRPAL